MLLFYVRDPVLPLVGALLMLLAAALAVAAVVRSPRPLTAALAGLAVLPLAVFVWAVMHWLGS